jgi:hypothetical protein
MLVEGPGRFNNDFKIRWLSQLNEVDLVYEAMMNDDEQFRTEHRDSLEHGEGLDLKLHGITLFKELDGSPAAVLPLEWSAGEPLTILVALGFLTLTGERYQLTIPETTEPQSIRAAVMGLCSGDKSLAPLVTMPKAKADRWKKALEEMCEPQRVSDRELLLTFGVDPKYQQVIHFAPRGQAA